MQIHTEEGARHDFDWLNPPNSLENGQSLRLTTLPKTDLWQRTHYGYTQDNAHCLLTGVARDFSLSVRTRFKYKQQYDQCGLIVRRDAENWIKLSTEFETDNHARLGSVVTSLAYSDWATIDIEGPLAEMWYRIQSKGQDFLLEYSRDGVTFRQLRICHLHGSVATLQAGIYACSPMSGSFDAYFDQLRLGDSDWNK